MNKNLRLLSTIFQEILCVPFMKNSPGGEFIEWVLIEDCPMRHLIVLHFRDNAS